MEGFITLDRKLLEWEWHDDPEMGWLWVNLLLMANWKATIWHGIKVERGQLLTTRKKLSEATGLSEMQVRKRLDILENNQQIIRKITNKNTIITICKYDNYQCSEGVVYPTNNQQNNQQITNKLNEKESNKEKENTKNNENNNRTYTREESEEGYSPVTSCSVPELTEGWVEIVQRMIYQNFQKVMTVDEVTKQYEDFKSREVDPFLLTTNQDWWQHFKNYVMKRINQTNQQNNVEDKYSKRKAAEVSIKNSNMSEGTF